MPAQGEVRDRLDPGLRLIETLGYRPGFGAVRAGRHLARMRRSAAMLGFAFDGVAAERRLSALAAGDTPLRLRLTLGRDGDVEAVATPFTPQDPATVWRMALAATRLSSGDAMLAHKTTARDAYDGARAEFDLSMADEVILLNERGEVCEGCITSVFVDFGDGLLVTPALACGLLPGVLREELIEIGRAVEAVLSPAELAAGQLHVGNSLRGLIPARLTG